MKLLAKQREGKKVRFVYDSAKTPLQRLLLSGVLSAEMQQELTEVAQALDPIRLLHQLEQLQQAVFRCAVGCAPVISPIPSTPLRVFSVQECTAGSILARDELPIWKQGSTDCTESKSGENGSWVGAIPTKTLLQESGSRSSPGWWPILNGAAATFSGNCSAALPDAISPCKSAHSNGGCEKYESPSCILERSSGKRK